MNDLGQVVGASRVLAEGSHVVSGRKRLACRTLGRWGGSHVGDVTINNLGYDNQYCGLTIHFCCSGLAASQPVRGIRIVINTFSDNGWNDEWSGGIHTENREARDLVIRDNAVSQNLSFQIADEGGAVQTRRCCRPQARPWLPGI